MRNSNTESKSIQKIIEEKRSEKNANVFMERFMPIFFLICAMITILTTVGIVLTLLSETVTFFKHVSILEFITSKEWYPMHSNPSFGILPLISGTLLIALIAILIAVPIGLSTAIFLSEYASEKVRKTIKPALEVLAGIPTIVYGFFALTFVTPLLQNLIPSLSIYNALSPGIVIGIMIVPMVASLSEDAMRAVPRPIREGAYAMGSTRFEVAIKVVVPAAFSGIISSCVLGLSRAIGETMIVTIAGGSNPIATLDITSSIQTMTAYMVQVSLGDAGYGTIGYYSIYAVGMTLFIFTFMMNLIAQFISKRFREEY